MGRSPGDVQVCSSCTFYVGRSTCEMHCNKSNGHMHDYAFLYMHIVLCICRDINYVCAFENIFAFRVGLTRSICIKYLLS